MRSQGWTESNIIDVPIRGDLGTDRHKGKTM